jgi:hypothetical protein
MTEPPTLRIVRGTPTPEELAAVTAVVTAASVAGASAAGDRADVPRRGRWNDPAACHRRPWRAGPGAWRASVR